MPVYIVYVCVCVCVCVLSRLIKHAVTLPRVGSANNSLVFRVVYIFPCSFFVRSVMGRIPAHTCPC